MASLWWLIILAAMAAYACYTDCRHREVSNRLVLCMALWTLSRMEFHGEAQHLLHPAAVLLVGGVLFQMNILAAGDSKLFAALSLAIDSQFIVITLLLIGFLGGVLAISQWWLGRMTADIRWTQRGVPYAVPICLASLLAIAASL
ncbi:A24 family peptidase [Vibrio gigantis]|uniref:Prepilin peptidase n=2 Tax=Vibrio gigantis TaxID=296199 RepID=A0A5M9N3G9_9VIBR|nr:A24 family peptidase [Vibrio gigantis]KAA8666519.1 prepilin peptidase [Vibrio gigantis]